MDVDAFLHPDRPRDEVRRELGLDRSRRSPSPRSPGCSRGRGTTIFWPSPPRFWPRIRMSASSSSATAILRDRLRADADRLGVGHAVIFTGLVPPDRIPGLLNGIDAVIHPSLREGLARVSAAGVDWSGDRRSPTTWTARSEVILPETGVLAPAPRPGRFTPSGAAALAFDPSLRDRMGREGRSRFAEPVPRRDDDGSIAASCMVVFLRFRNSCELRLRKS